MSGEFRSVSFEDEGSSPVCGISVSLIADGAGQLGNQRNHIAIASCCEEDVTPSWRRRVESKELERRRVTACSRRDRKSARVHGGGGM